MFGILLEFYYFNWSGSRPLAAYLVGILCSIQDSCDGGRLEESVYGGENKQDKRKEKRKKKGVNLPQRPASQLDQVWATARPRCTYFQVPPLQGDLLGFEGHPSYQPLGYFFAIPKRPRHHYSWNSDLVTAAEKQNPGCGKGSQYIVSGKVLIQRTDLSRDRTTAIVMHTSAPSRTCGC